MRIREEAIEAYAATLPAASPPAPDLAPGEPDERRAAFQLTLNAINFGSGWFPTLRKQPGMSGFRTVEAGLRARGPWTADELAAIDRGEVAATLGQDPEHELMGHFETALRELGAKVRDDHGGSFLALARAHDDRAEGARRPSSRPGRRGSTSRPTRSCGSRSSSAPRSPPPTSRSPASRPAPTCTA